MSYPPPFYPVTCPDTGHHTAHTPSTPGPSYLGLPLGPRQHASTPRRKCSLPSTPSTSRRASHGRCNQESPCPAKKSTSPPAAKQPKEAASMSPLPRSIIIERTKHQQFVNFAVTLLVFETPKAIENLLCNTEEAAVFSQSNALNPGELIAACLSGDEEAHARHIPIIGLPGKEATILNSKVESMVDILNSCEVAPITRQCSVWQAGDFDVYCDGVELEGQKGFEQLAHELAEVGDNVVHQHLYSWDKAPCLHASESRRMAFGERWTYASVRQGHSLSNSTTSAEWIREPDDDTLIPCLSVEWMRKDPSSFSKCRRLYSKTGYYVDISARPLLIILNRHFPHWRTIGLQYVQLVPPRIALTRAAVVRHRKFASVDRRESMARQLNEISGELQRAKRGFHSHQAIAHAALSHLSSFILESTASQASRQDQTPTLSAIRELAQQTKDVLQASQVCKYGCDTVLPTCDNLSRLLFTSQRCLRETFSPAEEELQPFALAMYSSMLGGTSTHQLSDEVVECFVIIARLCTANATVLCGKEVEPEEAEAESADVEVMAPGVEAALGRNLGKDSVKVKTHAEINNTSSLKRPVSPADTELTDETTESEFDFGPQYDIVSDSEDEDYVDLEEADIQEEVADSSSRKRSSKEPLSHHRTKKVHRVSGSASSSFVSRPALTRSKDVLDGDVFKRLIRRIIGRDTGKKQEDDLKDCAELFRTSVKHEVQRARVVPPEIVQICREAFEDRPRTAERRARLLMEAISKVFKVVEKDVEGADLEWVILSLAYQAYQTVNDLANKVERAYRVHFENKGKSTVSPFRQEVKKDVSLSDAFIDVVDQVKDLMESGSSSWKTPRQRYMEQQEVDKKLVYSLIEGRPDGYATGQSSTALTETTQGIAVPRVYLNFVNLAVRKGKRIERTAERFKESVIDVLFQAYFPPLVGCLTSKRLNGKWDTRDKNRVWLIQRRILKFRLQLIARLVDNGGMGTAVFAARACCDLVFAPADYLPLPRESAESGLYAPIKSYEFPRLVVQKGSKLVDVDAAADWQGWEAVYSSLRRVKGEILDLAEKKDPNQALISGR